MSLTPRRGTSSKILPKDKPFEDIELGDYSVLREHESTDPLIDAFRESSEDEGSIGTLSKSIAKPTYVSNSRVALQPLSWLRHRFQWLTTHVLMLLGCYQVVLIGWSVLDGLCPDNATSVLAAIGLDHRYHKDTLSLPHTVTPVACHSHNDYWRVRPFYTAIEMGCSSIEADIWLKDGDLLVAHKEFSTSPDHTLRNMYLKPILTFLDGHNPAWQSEDPEPGKRIGIFESDPEQTLVLLVDFKVHGREIWPVLQAQLEPLRRKKYLTYFDGLSLVTGPITIVVTGDASFEDVVKNMKYRDIFYDAPLEIMGSKAPGTLHDHDHDDETIYPYDPAVPAPVPPRERDFNTTEKEGNNNDDQFDERSRIPGNAAIYSPINSYYASVSFRQSIGYPWHSTLSRAQLEKIRTQIQGAHARGLKVRYWGVPSWPLGLRNYLWRVLVREGVDVLSVDDLEAVTLQDWGPRKGGWNRKWWP